MNEIERAIELFEDEVRILYGHGNLSSPESIDAHELALKLLRAELSRQENAPLTWNERINQMTVEEKAQFMQFKSREMYQKAMDYAWKFRKTGKLTSYYTERMIELLNSPYTEGDTDEG